MIDHTGLTVADVASSKAFYRAALGPLGYALIMEWEQYAGFGVPPKPDFWIGQGKPNVPPIHVAFRAQNRKEVDAFYKAAMAAGATALLVVQAAINLSVVLCLMPTKGIPLPFVSYGGSSLVASWIAAGLILNVSQHEIERPAESEN